ncbi:MAG TPA: acyl carrier protein [Isosphaeraceae bacterium]|jgi:acyl carrier protein
MMIAQTKVLDDVLDLMTQLAGDWEYSGAVTPETRLLADLEMESLDLVVLGTSLQERYGRLPFSEFLAEIGQRPVEERDVSVGELVAFVARHSTRITEGGN